MEPKDMDDPRNRRPAVPAEEKWVNVKRQVPHRPSADDDGDEEAYAIDPQDEPPRAPDVERTGAIADRARGERALFDREDENSSSEDAEESLTREELPAQDEVEINRKRP